MKELLLVFIPTLTLVPAAIAAALAMRKISSTAIEGMTRQPEIAGQLFTSMLVSMALVIPLSAFINNTPVVAVMIPVLLGLARRISARPSKLLMPVAFASQLGGTLTLIGTTIIFFALVNVMKLVPYFALGQFSPETLATSAVLLPFAIAANFLGLWLARRTPTELFYQITYVLMLVISLALIWQGAAAIAAG